MREQIAALPPPQRDNLEADLLPDLVEELLQDIPRFAPNILHFFCHGSTEHGPHLQLATRTDWLLGSGSKVKLDTGALASIPGIEQFVWLVTLNCCLGAASIPHAHSLARSLVARGFPAVIGMREVIDVNDANVFTRALYAELFVELQKYAAPAKEPVEICWPKMLALPRRYLRDRHAGDALPVQAAEGLKEWTLPVIYARRNPFKLLRPPSNNALDTDAMLEEQMQLKTLVQLREQLKSTPNFPAGVLQEINDKIDRLLTQLYPDEV